MRLISVSVTHDGYPVRGHLYVPGTSASSVDLIVLFHGTIAQAGDNPLAAAEKFLDYATSPSALNLGDRLIFSVAYPQDAIPGWTQEQAQAVFPGINLSTFYLGDNLPYVQAALGWALTGIDNYLSDNDVPLSRARIFTFGHSQGALLTHRLNRIYAVDGAVVNAPGPIDLLGRCVYSEANGDENTSCLKLKNAYGSTTENPDAYEDVSLRNYLDGLLSPSLYTQALDDAGGIQYGVSQVDGMRNVVEPALLSCSDCAPVTFRYYPTGGHPVFATNRQAQEDIRQFLTNGFLEPPPREVDDIYDDLSSSSPSAIIELYELQLSQALHGNSQVFRFYSGVNQRVPSGVIVWNAVPYQALPVEAEGFEYSGTGQLPRPTVKISNLFGGMSALLLGVNGITTGNDLTGAKFTRIRTLARFLDPQNFPNNTNPYGTPDPTAELPREVYYIDRKAAENREYVEFELASAFDLAGVRAPKRQVIANICQWKYRSPECGYTGNVYFDENDNPLVGYTPPSFTGVDRLTVGMNLDSPGQLVSANGWYRTVMQNDGNLVTYSKAGRVVWASGTIFPAGSYRLRNGVQGNLFIQRMPQQEIIWQTGTGTSGTVIGSLTQLGWVPNDKSVGRSASFGWEIFGAVYSAGITSTVTRTFSFPTTINPGRFITIAFTATSVQLPPDHYSGMPYAWILGSVSSVSAGGIWAEGEIFAPTVTTSSNNPFRLTPQGTIGATGPQLQAAQISGLMNNVLIMQNDGNLVLYKVGAGAVWVSGFSSNVEPVSATRGGQLSKDVCGKRLSSCKARFGDGAELPFGSFPSAGAYFG